MSLPLLANPPSTHSSPPTGQFNAQQQQSLRSDHTQQRELVPSVMAPRKREPVGFVDDTVDKSEESEELPANPSLVKEKAKKTPNKKKTQPKAKPTKDKPQAQVSNAKPAKAVAKSQKVVATNERKEEANGRGGRASGSRNFSNIEMTTLIEAVKRALPLGQIGWREVVKLYNKALPEDGMKRDEKSVKTKFDAVRFHKLCVISRWPSDTSIDRQNSN